MPFIFLAKRVEFPYHYKIKIDTNARGQKLIRNRNPRSKNNSK